MSTLTLLILSDHSSLGFLSSGDKEEGDSGLCTNRPQSEIRWQHLPEPGNQLLFSSNVSRSLLEGDKEVMQRGDRFLNKQT